MEGIILSFDNFCYQKINFIHMNNIDILDNIHFSYKHLDRHEKSIEKITNGFIKEGIDFSIDKHLDAGDNIRKYEEEIGKSKLVIIIITDEYLKSLQCMHEITEIIKNGNLDKRVVGIAELVDYARNGDGLKKIKDFWANEKKRKAEQIKTEPGGSAYVLRELVDIDDIQNHLNDVWRFLTDVITKTMEEISENDGEKLIKIIKDSLGNMLERTDIGNMPEISESTVKTFAHPQMQELARSIQHGEKSIYIEKNDGTININ